MTLKNREHSIDMGCSGFMALRQRIASLLSEEFSILYKNWVRPYSPISDDEGEQNSQIIL